MNNTKLYILLLFYNLISLFGNAQVNPSNIEQFVKDEDYLASIGIHYPLQVAAFYKNNQYKTAWIKTVNLSERQVLLHDLSSAANLGLNLADYQYAPIQRIHADAVLLNDVDSISAELLLTDVAIHFYGEVQNGNITPALQYDGLHYESNYNAITDKLIASLNNNKFSHFISEIEPVSQAYTKIKQQLLQLNTITGGKDFKEVTITSTKVSNTNAALVVKLRQLGLLDVANLKVDGAALVKKVRTAQELFNLSSDGALGSTTLQALNVPLIKREEELKIALNYIRWSNSIQQMCPVILVNIPSASLLVYDKGKVMLESKIVVGKPSTPTPTLSSTITNVVLYPYWVVPNDVVINELLPKIRHNNSFLTLNNFQVLDKQGTLINPSSINWHSVTTKNFPYSIRQSTGCDNTLGIVKLSFYNPYGIYLHDTPLKDIFLSDKRYTSNGHMPLEKALEVAYLLVNNHTKTIDALIKKGCLRNQEPIAMPADQPMDIFVIYSVAWYNKAGDIHFFDDVYGKMLPAKEPGNNKLTATFR